MKACLCPRALNINQVKIRNYKQGSVSWLYGHIKCKNTSVYSAGEKKCGFDWVMRA